jgi:group I intron endonuclease
MGFEITGVIYCLRNLTNGKIYVGSTTKPKWRKRQHFSDLRNQRHYNTHLQNAFSKYGERNFVWEVVEEVAVSNLADAEKKWIKQTKATDRQRGYNLTDEPYAPMRGKRHHPEAIAKMRSSSRKGSRHPNAKLDEKMALAAFEMNARGVKRSQIANELGVSVSALSLLFIGKIWKHLSASTIPAKKSKSGVTGVYQTANGKWMAEINKAGRRIHLGTHDELASAVKARKDAERGE